MTVEATKLVRMAGQIAANITASKDPQVITDKLVDHLQRFWDPRMRQQFVDYAKATESELDPILADAADRLSI